LFKDKTLTFILPNKMPEIDYRLLKKYLMDLKNDPSKESAPVYLIFGEELLVKTAYDELLDTLLPGDHRSAGYDPVETAAESIYDVIESINTFSLWSGTKVVAMRESRIFHDKADKNRLLQKAKMAYDDDNLEKAAKYFLSLMSNLNLSFEDVEHSNRSKAFKSVSDIMGEDDWLDVLVAYCQEKQQGIPQLFDQAGILQKAIENGFPKNNHLVITTDVVDKRRGLFKTISSRGVAVDCTVPAGDRRADRMVQEQVLHQKMAEILGAADKEMDSLAYRALVDMTGFDLRTFCGNLEKLRDYVGDRNTITVDDVETVLKRTRQDPIYDFTNAVADRQIEKALFFLNSLLAADFHPLQILAAIANQVRRLILAKGFTKDKQVAGWHAGLSYSFFQQNVMPAVAAYDHSLLKLLEDWAYSESLPEDVAKTPARDKGKRKAKVQTDLLLARNPKNAYPVYQLLKKSEQYSESELLAAVGLLNEADIQLKTSSQEPKLILERLLFKLCDRQKAAS
jgi:DNA polymerase-3 subunit delta